MRLFPLYWLAHLVFLVSPFVILHDPVDYRFLLSFFGDRVYPVDKMFFYLVPAWWFLGLLIETLHRFPGPVQADAAAGVGKIPGDLHRVEFGAEVPSHRSS